MISEKGKYKENRDTLRDTELLKVQIYSSNCHAVFTVLVSFILAFFVSVSVLLYASFYQGSISSEVWMGGLIVVWVFTVASLYVILRTYKRDFKKISDMIEMIRQGKELPTLEKLGRKVGTNDSKTSEQKENGNEAKEHKLWYLGIATSLSGSLLIACAVQSVNSSGLVKVLWTLFYILAGIFFFGTSQKAGKIMGVSRYYIRGLQIAMITIVTFGSVGILLTEILLK